MHALILSSSTDTHSPEEPLKTAEEVLREIDDIMQVTLTQSNILADVIMTKVINDFATVGKSVNGKITGFRGFFIGQ